MIPGEDACNYFVGARPDGNAATIFDLAFAARNQAQPNLNNIFGSGTVLSKTVNYLMLPGHEMGRTSYHHWL
jgi:hypothetical protein